jgi:transcriptional regulator with XRE-family HTH domain
MNPEASNIAAALKRAREAKGLTQRALSELAGLPQSHISKIENGTVDLRVSSLVELARVLDLELTLVPRKALPAVHSIIRSRSDDRFTGRSGVSVRNVLNELKQLQKDVAHLMRLHPTNTELAQLQRHVRDLQRLEIPQQHLDTLRLIHNSIKKSRDAGDLAPLRRPLRELQDLRNSIAHSGRFSPVEKVRPAYSLDEEDEHGE